MVTGKLQAKRRTGSVH